VLDPQTIVLAIVLVGTRIAGLMTFAPFFGSLAISWRVKAVLTVLLTFLLYPLYGHRTPVHEMSLFTVMLGEVAIGMMFGLAMQLIFEGAQIAGQIAGMQVGYSLVSLIDPQTEVDTPVLSVFHQSVVMLIFLQLGVHHWMLRGIANSFESVPPGTVTFGHAAFEQLFRAGSQMWSVGVRMAAPVLAVTILADVALVFIGRAAPQLPIMFMGISVKAMLSFSVLASAVTLWPKMFNGYFRWAYGIGAHVLHVSR
jgi:flagellar biosynthetic protein FliR